jgi:hypothetical protein
MPRVSIVWRFDKYYLINMGEYSMKSDLWILDEAMTKTIEEYQGVIVPRSGPYSYVYFRSREQGEKFMDDIFNPLLVMEEITGEKIIKC